MKSRNAYFKPGDELYRCDVCGEYRGKVKRKDLNWGSSGQVLHWNSEEYITVSCLCDGFVCKKCGKNRVHRPISNSYDEETNTIEHWPYFTGLMNCSECREKEKQQSEKE